MNDKNPSADNYQINYKDNIRCPNCGKQICEAAGVTPHHSGSLRKGQIMVCSMCFAPSIMGDSNLEPLNETRFKELPPHVQRAVFAIVNTIKGTVEENAGN